MLRPGEMVISDALDGSAIDGTHLTGAGAGGNQVGYPPVGHAVRTKLSDVITVRGGGIGHERPRLAPHSCSSARRPYLVHRANSAGHRKLRGIDCGRSIRHAAVSVFWSMAC